MRSILCAIIAMFSLNIGQSQNKSVLDFSLLEQLKVVQKKGSEIHIFIEGSLPEIKKAVVAIGGIVKYEQEGIVAAVIPLEGIPLLSKLPFVKRIETASNPLVQLNDKMIYNNNVVPVHLGVAPLTQGYDGKGVIIGIIDYGLDFDHPDFKDEGGRSRVKYLWQHTSSNEINSPNPYKYGKEWTNQDIDKGLVPHVAEELHGTHVTGIAAGNGLAVNNYKGIAPQADIIFVSLNPADLNSFSNVVDAAKYIFSKADSLGKPCVINASIGDFSGARDGKDLQARLINNMVAEKNGRSFVCAAGNSGNVRFHLRNLVHADTSFTWVKKTTQNFSFQLWADSLNLTGVKLAIGADATNPQIGFRGNTAFQNLAANIDSVFNDSIVFHGKRIARISRLTQYINGRFAVNYTITADSANFLFRLMATGKGMYDVWDFDLVSDQLPSSSVFPDIVHYVVPDVNQTIASSFTCAPNVITVGNYVNRNFYSDVNGTVWRDTSFIPGKLYTTSSSGPTRDGRIKPEITAPGTIVLSAVPLSQVPFAIAHVPYKIAAGGKHIRNSGTSMASPMVAGIVALYLQKNPDASFSEIKDALTKGAKKDSFTGSILPDNKWGYGKADAFKMLVPTKVLGGKIILEPSDFCAVYPNPFSVVANVDYEINEFKSGHFEYWLTDLYGHVVRKIPLSQQKGSFELNRETLASGFYYYLLVVDGKKSQGKKVIIL